MIPHAAHQRTAWFSCTDLRRSSAFGISNACVPLTLCRPNRRSWMRTRRRLAGRSQPFRLICMLGILQRKTQGQHRRDLHHLPQRLVLMLTNGSGRCVFATQRFSESSQLFTTTVSPYFRPLHCEVLGFAELSMKHVAARGAHAWS